MASTFMKKAVSICIILIIFGCVCFCVQHYIWTEKPVTGSSQNADTAEHDHRQRALYEKATDEENYQKPGETGSVYEGTAVGDEVIFNDQRVEEMNSDERIIAQGEQYLYREAEGECELLLYDREGKIVFSETYPQELRNHSGVNETTENILEIWLSVGSPAVYKYYFNKESAEISDTFFNPELVGDFYIAYMEDNNLIVRDIFHEDLFSMTIVRDFTGTADPMSAVISIEMADSENIILTYYKGEDYTETSEIIEIGNRVI